jgi:hypothetical protein
MIFSVTSVFSVVQTPEILFMIFGQHTDSPR